jgi:hypothetical protein
MNVMPNETWFTCLPDCETTVPCAQGRHIVRWEAGSLRLPSHPDAEAEAVLAALGGDKARCVEVARAWERHADDLSVLAIGPRGPADRIAVGWADVDATAQSDPIGPVAGFGLPQTGPMRPGTMKAATGQPGTGQPGTGQPGTGRPGPGQLASPPPPVAMARAAARRKQMQAERDQTRLRRGDMLSLLALGYGFQVRLIGQVAAAYAARDPVGVRPALVAAIAGRLAPVAEQWLGIDPDQVVVTLHPGTGHEGSGWGSAELTGKGEDRRLRVSLPAGWLASVWACGLALVGRHLVVAVEEPGWPTARVLGLRSPGAEPEPLDVHASTSGPADVPHWEV